MSRYSKEHCLKNGMDIAEVYGRNDVYTEMVISGAIGYVHTAFVHYLNQNGFAEAGQALDDLWHERGEQWWREPDGFDGHYSNGDDEDWNPDE